MQRYSVQLSYKTRKYYKTLFLGLVGMALVNAFIVFRHNKKVNGEQEVAPPCAGRWKRRAYGYQWWIRERSLSPLRGRQERGRGCAHDGGLMDLFF
ncbi:hypothetical protein PI126_g23305 [Phytophthora idaei]|nr:hypothetical protein PI126_g23305 [Phytophthora idaei]